MALLCSLKSCCYSRCWPSTFFPHSGSSSWVMWSILMASDSYRMKIHVFSPGCSSSLQICMPSCFLSVSTCVAPQVLQTQCDQNEFIIFSKWSLLIHKWCHFRDILDSSCPSSLLAISGYFCLHSGHLYNQCCCFWVTATVFKVAFWVPSSNHSDFLLKSFPLNFYLYHCLRCCPPLNHSYTYVYTY
jgi:hypothetical protein